MELYDFIETLCVKNGETITSMCKAAGISRGSFGDLKAGRIKSLSSVVMKKVALHFGITLDELVNCELKEAEKEKKLAIPDELSDFDKSVINDMHLLNPEKQLELRDYLNYLLSKR